MIEPSSKSVLVLEDEALVGMFIEEELLGAGYVVVGPFASCAEATGWLATDTPDVAILDYRLKDGPSTGVAIELRRRGVRLLALTGTLPEGLPEVLRDAPKLLKPDGLDRLPFMLESLLVD